MKDVALSLVPLLRQQAANDRPVQPDGEFVLYWMIAARRATWNFGLQRAVEWAKKLNKPLLVFEPLRVGYRWASDRIHRFVIDGMRDNTAAFAKQGVAYFPYVEPTADADKGLLAVLATRACVVVTDEFPCFFLPRMVASAAKRLPVLVEVVDSNGLLPLRAATQTFPTALAFRSFLQKNLKPHLAEMPAADPLAGVRLPRLEKLPEDIARRWPAVSREFLDGELSALAALPIDHSVGVVETRGGSVAGRAAMREFLSRRLTRYEEDGNHPDVEARSGLSPYLHFGHVSAHEVFHELVSHELDWTIERPKTNGGRRGWWGVAPHTEAFLDELITWRELGYNFSSQRDDYDQFESLPAWAQATLAKHEADPREHVYTLDEFEQARTHDDVWNAAQTQLLREGRIHNYLRMLWGKKILEWSRTPRETLDVMIELNNKYALDGRNPNSYSGIFWVLGRFDRPWGPERPIFGTIRYMSSDNTVRKLHVKEYLRRYVPSRERRLF